MATERQIEANRLNAGRSTGPNTAAGKEVSRLNATKHGLTAEQTEAGPVFEARRAKWAKDYRTCDERGEQALDQLVAATLRLDHCQKAFDATIDEQTARASTSWDADRRVIVLTLASKLSNRPMLVTAQLETSWHGCGVMIEMWYSLLAALDLDGAWNETETSAALDLMGINADLRRGRTALDANEGTDASAHRREVAVLEIERLVARREELAPLDALDRARTEAGAAAFESKMVQLILRYEREALNRFERAFKELRKPSTDPLPELTPEPQARPVAPPTQPAPVRPPAPDRRDVFAPIQFGEVQPHVQTRNDLAPILGFSVGKPSHAMA